MKKSNLGKLFLLFMLFTSCDGIHIGTDPNPDYNSEVTVTVTTNTGEPVEDISLELRTIKGYVSTSTGYKTDANGQIWFTYTGPVEGSVKVSFGGSQNYCAGGSDYIQPYYQQQYGFQLFPKGWIKLHVKNVNPWNGDDVISITASCYSVGYVGLTDITEHHKTGGNETKTINWTVHKNNVTNKFSDTLYIPWNDTVDYEILY